MHCMSGILTIPNVAPLIARGVAALFAAITYAPIRRLGVKSISWRKEQRLRSPMGVCSARRFSLALKRPKML